MTPEFSSILHILLAKMLRSGSLVSKTEPKATVRTRRRVFWSTFSQLRVEYVIVPMVGGHVAWESAPTQAIIARTARGGLDRTGHFWTNLHSTKMAAQI